MGLFCQFEAGVNLGAADRGGLNVLPCFSPSSISFGLMVLSSVIAAWADIKHALESHGTATTAGAAEIATLNSGYIWMMVNCLSTAAYVLGMRKRIKLTNFKDFDSMTSF